MGNVIDYVSQESRSFAEYPFTSVDALVLAALAYQRMPQRVPSIEHDFARYGTLSHRLGSFTLQHPIRSVQQLKTPPFSTATLRDVRDALRPEDFRIRTGHAGLGDPKLTEELFDAVASNPRFNSIRVGGYCERYSIVEQTQFAAVTMMLPDGTLVVSFRGTDDSFVGWREDFNMAFQYPVPAQESAGSYVRQVAAIWKKNPIITTGHSKGGNLAVYAGLAGDDKLRDRLIRMYSLDGPGFPNSVVQSYEYFTIMDRIVKIVPDSSIVGMILEAPERSTVVKSNQYGILQHLLFNWQIENGSFIEESSVAAGSQYFNTALNEWISNLSPEQRKRAVEALFTLVYSSGTDHVSGILSTFPKAIPEVIGSFVGLREEDRKNMLTAFNLLVKASLTRNTKR